MYRSRSLFRLKPSAATWNEAMQLVEQVNELSRARGWAEATVWTQAFGPFNEIVLEQEYPDLATYEREQREVYADAEAMALFTRTTELLREDLGHNELWIRAEPVGG